MWKKLILCAFASSLFLFTSCQKQDREEGITDISADNSGNSEISTSSGDTKDDRPTGCEWTDEDKEYKDVLYPGFELSTVVIDGVSYRTLTADNGCVITDNGNVFLSPYKNDYSGVYTFTLKYSGTSYPYTEIMRTPIGGYTSGNFASRVPRVSMTDVTGDGAEDIVIRVEDYDKDDGSTKCDIFVYDCKKETSVRIPVDEIKHMLSDKFVSDKMTVEGKTARTFVKTPDGKTKIDFEYEMPENAEALSDITVIPYSDYILVGDSTIYCGVWLGSYIDYEEGYYPVTGNYTAYAAALYVPLVYDEGSVSFTAGDMEDIVLIPAKTTLNYACNK